ncbi:MAG: F0F1 ATP synthase subunit A [Candidatus Bruticola sp.]
MGWSYLGGAASGIFLASAPIEAVGFANIGNQVLIASTVLVIAASLVLAFIGRKHLGVVSTGMGAVFEHVYEFVNDMAYSFMGERGERYTPFAMSIFLFVLLCNWSGLMPVPAVLFGGEEGHAHLIFEAPTASYNTTLALAIVSCIAFTYYGLKQKICGDPLQERREAEEDAKRRGLSAHEGESKSDKVEVRHFEDGHGLFSGFIVWLRHYLGPVPQLWQQFTGVMRYVLVPALAVLFCGLNVIEEVARLLSLSFRLYGNIHGEHEVKSNLFSVGGEFFRSIFAADSGMIVKFKGAILSFTMWGVSLFVTCIGALAGFIQAFVFCILTLSYISHLVADEH